jgi:hypothetical protein
VAITIYVRKQAKIGDIIVKADGIVTRDHVREILISANFFKQELFLCEGKFRQNIINVIFIL